VTATIPIGLLTVVASTPVYVASVTVILLAARALAVMEEGTIR